MISSPIWPFRWASEPRNGGDRLQWFARKRSPNRKIDSSIQHSNFSTQNTLKCAHGVNLWQFVISCACLSDGEQLCSPVGYNIAISYRFRCYPSRALLQSNQWSHCVCQHTINCHAASWVFLLQKRKCWLNFTSKCSSCRKFGHAPTHLP